ncbi:proteasome ATPase [Propionibacteriaceae bacterium Y1923]|uniref:proteasome ATPase n=1 Tax=Aestuariimicrobium sp. Y1814 TaxID=3418742 RepID=UPI003C1C857E
MTEPPLERRLSESRAETRALAAQNETLTRTLKEARGQLVELRQRLDRLGAPPLTRGRVVEVDDEFVDVFVLGRVMRVVAAADVVLADVNPGDLVLLNEGLVITAHRPGSDTSGEVARVVEASEGHAIVAAGQDEVRLRLVGSAVEARAGDTVRIERGAGLALEHLVRQQVEELVLTEVPDVSYADIGGLAAQIGQIRDAVELPFLQRERFADYRLTPPKGVLLYGPPGCGKTMIAKAVARSLGEQLHGDLDPQTPGSIFINVKGPELLNKYVGESERQVRLIFERARQHATSGRPVIVFFDEMDSLFRTRGSGISSDVESTVVPQLLSEIDGVVGLDNVIVIGASNREDMIDPAILRAGRLDVKIRLDRPDAQAARDILAKYLVSGVPLAGDDPATLIDAVVDDVYARDEHNQFLEVTYTDGDTETLYFADFASGAMLRNIVDRAKRIAIKEELAGRAGGVSRAGLLQAARDEFRENEDLPNTTNPDDWARISGRRGRRISWVRSLVGH